MRRLGNLQNPAHAAKDDYDKSDEKEDAPAGEPAVGVLCHGTVESDGMQQVTIEKTTMLQTIYFEPGMGVSRKMNW